MGTELERNEEVKQLIISCISPTWEYCNNCLRHQYHTLTREETEQGRKFTVHKCTNCIHRYAFFDDYTEVPSEYLEVIE